MKEYNFPSSIKRSAGFAIGAYNMKNKCLNIVTPPSLPFADLPPKAKVIMLQEISARCDPHHIAFIHQPLLAQLEMPLIFQPMLRSSWPQVCCVFFPNMITLCWMQKNNTNNQCLNADSPLCPPFTDHFI